MFSLLETLVKITSGIRKSDMGAEEPPVAVPEIRTGGRWKHLLIRRSLGRGHFGVVYQAYDSHLNREVALKFLSGALAMQEGKLLARIHDESVVKVYSIEEDQGLTAICMEWVDGVDLESYLAPKGCLDPMHVAVIGRRLAGALARVHRAGLLHRDIKAQNVLLTKDSRTVLVDFGLGVPIDSNVNDFAGTLPYMAPELFEGNRSTRASDIYALGVLLFHLASGKYPIVADSVETFRRLHQSGARVPLADCASVPEAFEDLVERATAANPSERFQSAGTLAAALEKISRDRPAKRRRALRAIWAGVGLTGMAIGAWALRGRFEHPPEPVDQLLESQIGVYDDPSLSEDGRVLVFSSDKAGNGDLDIWVKYTKTGASKVLTGPGGDEVEPAVSVDGTMVAYRSEKDGAAHIDSTLGGQDRLLAAGGRYPRFSPDGTRVAFWTGEEGSSYSARTYVIPTAGGQAVQILPDFADCRFPVWSPDGKYLLVTATRDRIAPSAQGRDWWLVPTNKLGSPVRLGFYATLQRLGLDPEDSPPHWSGDRVVFGARHGETANIWQIGIDGDRISDQPKSLTSDTVRAESPWSLRDGTVAFAAVSPRINIWSLQLEGPHLNLVRETHTLNFDLTPHISSDGRTLLFTRIINQHYETWVGDRKNGTERRLPFSDHASSVLSPKGDKVVYAPESSSRSLIQYQLESGESRTICDECGPPLDWSPDGTHILYGNARGEIGALDIVSISHKLLMGSADHNYVAAAVSPDGHRVALTDRIDSDNARIQTAGLSNWTAEPPERWIDIAADRAFNDKPVWSKDGRTLYYHSNKDGFGCIWEQHLAASGRPSGPAIPLIHLHSARLTTLLISQPSLNLQLGGGRLFINLDETTGALWLRRPH